MLADLKKVEDNFYGNQSIEQFLKTRTIHEVIKMLNKTNKQETRTRIKEFFYRIIDSNSYKSFLLAGIDQGAEQKSQFQSYMASDNCQQYFDMLYKKASDVVILLDSNIGLIPVIFGLVYSPTFGIKMIKLFSEIYSKYNNHDCLYTQQIKNELEKGLKSENTVVQMRFVEIIANIAIHGGKSFQFVKEILEKSLDIYQTEDILLKLNIIQIVAVLGDGAETSQLLRGHKIWTKVQKDALDPTQEFYVRKSLLILLVSMSTFQQYQITPKFTKSTIDFLWQCFKGQGQQLQAGLQLSSYLLRSLDGAKILIQNSQVFGLYLKLSRSPQERIKTLFVQNMSSLANKINGKKNKQIVMNIINCVGNPNLSNQLSQNVNSNNFMVQGIEGFCKWFVHLLQLPFQQLEINLIGLFYYLLQYNQICEELFENQATTKYILRPVGKGNTIKVLRAQKNNFVHKLIEKGKKDWKNTKLQAYAIMIEKQLLKQKMEVEIAMQAL